MKPIKTLSYQDRKKILEAYKGPDLIFDEVQKEAAFFKNRTCLKCGSKSLVKVPQMRVKREGDVSFKEPIFGDILPKNFLKCESCNCEFDPYTGLITGGLI